ncbi:MAG: RnfH family protein [Steroidobacteraceae bacterium]|jgi:putative ubiquitin-RnfH superfamily antitoxin RatB of RatAB toxin-antitoxin module
MSERFTVQFATASPDWQISLLIKVERGATVEDVLKRARVQLQAREDGAAQRVGAEAPWMDGVCGVFGEVCAREQRVEPGDRIELYLPLQADPKLERRRRAEASQTAKARNPLTTRSRR